MAARKPDQGEAGKRAQQQTEDKAPAPAKPAEHTPSFVDFDPWSMLMTQLMEAPEESEPVKRKGPKVKQGRVASRPPSR